jgi:Spx/MgsR family transcriptional regulator
MPWGGGGALMFSISRHHKGSQQMVNSKLHRLYKGVYLPNCKSFFVNLLFWQIMEILMKLTFYGLKSCDTCKKSLKTLRNAGYTVTYVDIRADGIDAQMLAKFQCKFGQSLTNTRSTTWRNLSIDDRKRPALSLLSEHPTLMKRPVIVAKSEMFLGWSKDVQAKF